jgi:ABC-2 type transport system ATP-binding protein
MTQKTVLAAALLTEPRVLVLDEPLSGLDVETTMLVKEVMREFAHRGGTLLYSSHQLDVVERVADRVAVIDKGQLRALGTLAELRQQAGAESEQRLEQLFAQLTGAGDPVARAKELLGS